MAEAKIKENCSWCKYFWGDNIIMGVCKRFPTTINKHDADWCGEFSKSDTPRVVIPEPASQLVENFAQLKEAMPELAEAAEGLMEISVEPKKRGRKPKNA